MLKALSKVPEACSVGLASGGVGGNCTMGNEGGSFVMYGGCREFRFEGGQESALVDRGDMMSGSWA